MPWGLLPAFLCCVAAFLDVSAAGAGYLAAFLAWGAIINKSRRTSKQAARALWRTVSAASAVLFVARILTQVLYSVIDADGTNPGKGSKTAWLLQWLGLGSPRPPPTEMLLLLGAPLITGLAAASLISTTHSSHAHPGTRPGTARPAGRPAPTPGVVLYSSGSPGAAASRTYNTQRSLPSTSRPHAQQEPPGLEDSTYLLRSATSVDDLPVQATKPPAKGFWAGRRHQRTVSNMSFTGDEADAWTFMARAPSTPADSPPAQTYSPPQLTPSQTAGANSPGALAAAAANAPGGTPSQLPRVTSPGTCTQLSSSCLFLITCLAAILWPGLLNITYVVVVIIKAFQWARAARDTADSWRPALVHTLQGFVGAHCVLLYGAQPLLRQGDPHSFVHEACNVLGLYSLSSQDDFTSSASKGLQATHLVSVYLMYVISGWYLGSLHARAPTKRPAPPDSTTAVADATSPSFQLQPGAGATRSESLQGALTAGLHWLATNQHGAMTHLGPHALSMIICVTSMVQVTLISGVMLFLGLVTLVMPLRLLRQVLRPLSPHLVMFFSLWLSALYAASCVHPPLNLHLSPVVQAVGLPVGLGTPHTVALLAGTVLLLICSASLAHHLCYQHARSIIQEVLPSQQLPVSPPGTPPTAGPSPAPFLQLAWYMCSALEPVAWLLLGMSYTDLLHSAYQLHFITSVARSCLGTHTLLGSRAQYRNRKASLLIRMFAGAHLAVLYAIMVAQLPGMEMLQSGEQQASEVLQLLGLINPDVLRDCVPLLGALALSTLHASLNKQLSQQQQQLGTEADPCQQGWLQPVTRWLESLTASVGHVLLGVTVLILACTSVDVGFGLLGAGYLVLAALLMALPPSKDRHLPRGPPVSRAPHSSPAPSAALVDLEQPLLAQARRARQHTIDPGHWIVLLLCCWSVVDLTTRLVVMLLGLVAPDTLTPQLKELLSDLLGVRVEQGQTQLLATAVTPALTLLLVQAFRWWFVAAVAHTQEPSPMKAFSQQYSWSWLIKRATILHCDQLAAILAFGLALKAPSILGSLTVAFLAGLTMVVTWCGRAAASRVARSPRRLKRVAVGLSQVFTSAWLLTQYLVQVPWITGHVIGIEPHGPHTCASLLLKWLGVAVPTTTHPLVDDSRAVLLIAFLGVLAMSRKADRWLEKLPPILTTSAPLGQACCLFWPPSSGLVLAAYQPLGGSEQIATDEHVWQVVPATGPVDITQEFTVCVSRETHDDARAQLLAHLSGLTRPVQAVLEVVVMSPLRQLLSVLFSRLKEGTHTVMDVMDIPHTPHASRGSRVFTPGGGFYTPDGQLSRSHSPVPPDASQPHLPAATGATTGAASGRAASPSAGGGSSGARDIGLPQVLPAVRVGAARKWPTGSGPAATGCVGGAEGGRLSPVTVQPPPLWSVQDALYSKPYLALLLLSARDVMDTWVMNWGLDINLGLMLLSAFALSNVLSGLYVAAVVLGTINPTGASRVRFWRFCMLPCLSLILLYQYLSWVGWWGLLPPLDEPACVSSNEFAYDDDDGDTPSRRPSMPPWIAWLGAGHPDTSAMWLLLLTLGATSLQVVRDAAGSGSGTGSAASGVQGPVQGATQGVSIPAANDPEAPPPVVLTETARNLSMQPPLRATSPAPPVSPGPISNGGYLQSTFTSTSKRQVPHILGPFLYGERHKWGTLDWLFFFTLKYSFDALLVCVVLLCTVQRDLVHAGYLALALLLFRKRGQLQQAAVRASVHGAASGAAPAPPPPGQLLDQGLMLRGTPFWMLPAFNLLVLVLQLMYQAPFHTLIGNAWDNACHAIPTWGPNLLLSRGAQSLSTSDPTSSTCTLPQLLGLCKLHPSGGTPGPPGPSAPNTSALWALLTTEAIADVVLWLLLRLHAKLLTSIAYQQVMACVLHQQARIRAARRQWERDSTEAQAHAALATGLQQVVRAQRVAKLKALFCEPMDGPGRHGPALFESLGSVAGLAEVLDSDLPLDTATFRLKTPSDPPLGPQALLRPVDTDKKGPVATDSTRQSAQHFSSQAAGSSKLGLLHPSRSHESGLGSFELVPTISHPQEGSSMPGQQPLPQHAQHTVTTIYRPQLSEDQAADLSGGASAPAAPRDQGPFAALVPGDVSEGGRPGEAGAAKEASQSDKPPPAGWRAGARANRARSDTEFFPVWLTSAPDRHVTAVRPRAAQHLERRSWIHRAWVFIQTQQYRGRNKWIVCLSFLLVLVTDWSILALLPPLSLVLYTLLAHHPKPAYWKASLVYAESLLVLQYTYLSLTSCMCSTTSSTGGGGQHPSLKSSLLGLTAAAAPGMRCSGWLARQDLQWNTRVLGLHETAGACLPMFIMYLTVLMYNYHLSSIQRTGSHPEATAAARQSPRAGSGGFVHWLRSRVGASTHVFVWCGQQIRAAGYEMAKVYWMVSQTHEVSKHWLHLHITWPHPSLTAQSTSSPAAQTQLCEKLVGLMLSRRQAAAEVPPPPPSSVTASLPRQDSAGQLTVKRPGHSAAMGATAGVSDAGPSAEQSTLLEQASSRSFEAGQQGGEVQTGDEAGPAVEGGGDGNGNGGGTEAGGSVMAEEDAKSLSVAPGRWLRSLRVAEVSALRMEHCMVRPDGCTAVMLLEVFPPETQPWELPCPRPAAAAAEELQTIAEEQARMDQELQVLNRMHRSQQHQHSPQHQQPPPAVGPATAPSSHLQASTSSATLVSAPSTATSNADGSLGMVVEEMACFEASYPPASTEPAPQPPLDTAQGLGSQALPSEASCSRLKQGVQGVQGEEPGRSFPELGFRLGDVKAHSRNPHDLYAWTLTVDLVAFLYAALFYEAIGNPVPGSVSGLVDLGDNTRTLPLAYLAALMALFALIVAERTVYILGSSTGKLVLHLCSLALVLPWCLVRFWQAPDASPARHHLRVFLVLRSLSWALGAQQLMWGYPPLSGTGSQNYRHCLIFYRKPDTWNYVAYQAFAAVPFLYELRTLLDWTCTPTTLDLYTWLKLEDIRGSLYVASARQRMAAGRQPGDPVPRYIKIFQGALILGLLLLVIWLPPLVFSQGAPTYTTPSTTAVSMNLTVTQMASPGGPSSQRSFPLFEAGFSYSVQDWGLLSNGSGSQPPPPAPILPPLLSGYDASQVQLVCMAQASQSVWLLSPPARQALVSVLNSSSAALSFSWAVTRSAPMSTGRGAGPGCATSFTTILSGKSRQELMEVSQGLRTSCVLERLNASDPDGSAPGHGGYLDLWPLLWRARGEICTLKPGLDVAAAGQDRPTPDGTSALRSHLMDMDIYSQQSVSCSVSQTCDEQGVSSWWEMSCQVLDSEGLPLTNTTRQPQTTCPDTNQGPQMVLVLERVQSGFLGATLSSFGITGLYITFVYGIARLLRLSIGNLRLKIPTEDLPSCRRLVTLCQDIYTARAQGELMLEEQLTMCLINIYRSPAVLFELTRRQRST